ncbi:MAG TPA: hypothetical protein VJ398_06265 [Acidimicrobiia bacterium]|nr:hypothetical protein [Acidimicrobiia bacterium]
MRNRQTTALRELYRTDDRAIETVVARYQKVAAAVTRVARTLAGNDRLRVRLGSEPAASADEVVIDPRLFQEAYGRNAPVTPSEVALASALHEVVHLVSSNFEGTRELPAEWPNHAPDTPPLDLLTAVQVAAGPLGEAFFFALEDARQESRGLVQYQGARSVLYDLYRAALPEAFSTFGGLALFGLCSFLLTGAYAERGELERRIQDPRVTTALAEASEVFAEAAIASDPWQVAFKAFELIEIARRNRLVSELPTQATPAQAEKRQELDAESVAEAIDRVRLASPIVRDAESYEKVRSTAEARSRPEGSRGRSEVAGDESTEQLLRISQAPLVYLPNGQGGKLVVGPVPESFRAFAGEGRAALEKASLRWGVIQRAVTGELFPLFAANQRRGLRSGYDQGDVSPHAAMFIGAGLYQRLYERRSARTRRRYAVSLLVDASASMLQPRLGDRSGKTSWGLAAALLGAWTMARLCDDLQIDFEVALFNRSFAARPSDSEWTYTRSRNHAIAGLRQTQGTAAERLSSTVNHYLIKPYQRRWREAEDLLAGLFWTAAEPVKAAGKARREPRSSPPVSMFEKAANVDEFNLIHAAERMARLGASVRVMMVLADGMTRGSVEGLSAAVTAIENSGTTVLGIGIGDDTVCDAYGRSEVVERPDELTRAMVDGTRAALRRSLALWGMDTWWGRPVGGEVRLMGSTPEPFIREGEGLRAPAVEGEGLRAGNGVVSSG